MVLLPKSESLLLWMVTFSNAEKKILGMLQDGETAIDAALPLSPRQKKDGRERPIRKGGLIGCWRART